MHKMVEKITSNHIIDALELEVAKNEKPLET